MSKSLQDQLMGAGLIDGKKAKKISKDKRKEKNEKRRNKDDSLSESQASVQKAKQEKLARDQQLNQQRNQEAEKKALAAQVAQLIGHYKLARRSADVEFNFTHGSTIKKILVTSNMADELSRGRLCIACVGESYDVIPKPIADKIRERDESAVVVYNEKASEQGSESSEADDDYYAQFEIPDDLVW